MVTTLKTGNTKQILVWHLQSLAIFEVNYKNIRYFQSQLTSNFAIFSLKTLSDYKQKPFINFKLHFSTSSIVLSEIERSVKQIDDKNLHLLVILSII